MTDKLPPNLLALFAPRPPLRWVAPSDFAPEKRKTAPISGVAAYLPALQEYKETDVYEPTESWLQRKDRIKMEKKAKMDMLMGEGIKDCKSPHQGNNGVTVPPTMGNGGEIGDTLICSSTPISDIFNHRVTLDFR
jgi:U1 small nuclear ribonucleoprotein